MNALDAMYYYKGFSIAVFYDVVEEAPVRLYLGLATVSSIKTPGAVDVADEPFRGMLHDVRSYRRPTEARTSVLLVAQQMIDERIRAIRPGLEVPIEFPPHGERRGQVVPSVPTGEVRVSV